MLSAHKKAQEFLEAVDRERCTQPEASDEKQERIDEFIPLEQLVVCLAAGLA